MVDKLDVHFRYTCNSFWPVIYMAMALFEDRWQMKIIAKVSRGPQKGEIVTPHRHEDGTYVVSSTRFEKDYIRVATLEDFASEIRKGLKGRMSSPAVKGPRLLSPSSIKIES